MLQNNSPSIPLNPISQEFLDKANKQLNEFKENFYDKDSNLISAYNKIEQTFKCALYTGSNEACNRLIELYDEVTKKLSIFEGQNTNLKYVQYCKNIIILIGRELDKETYSNIPLTSNNIERFLKATVNTQLDAIRIYRSQDNNKTEKNENQIIDEFNKILDKHAPIAIIVTFSENPNEIQTEITGLTEESNISQQDKYNYCDIL